MNIRQWKAGRLAPDGAGLGLAWENRRPKDALHWSFFSGSKAGIQTMGSISGGDFAGLFTDGKTGMIGEQPAAGSIRRLLLP